MGLGKAFVHANPPDVGQACGVGQQTGCEEPDQPEIQPDRAEGKGDQQDLGQVDAPELVFHALIALEHRAKDVAQQEHHLGHEVHHHRPPNFHVTAARNDANDDHDDHRQQQSQRPDTAGQAVRFLAFLGDLTHEDAVHAHIDQHDEEFDQADGIGIAAQAGLAQVARGDADDDQADEGLKTKGNQQQARVDRNAALATRGKRLVRQGRLFCVQWADG